MDGYVACGCRTLAEMCLRKALDNILLIEDVTGLPEKYLRPILSAVKNAPQLRKIEVNSGEIYEETTPHWQRLIRQDFSTLAAKHNFVASGPESWHEVYERYKKLQDEQVAADTERIMKAFAERDQEKTARSSKIISAKKGALLRPVKPKTGWGAPRAPQTFLSKTREQVRQEAQRFKLKTPTGKLVVPAGQIKKAPPSKVAEARIAQQPSVLETRMIRAPRPISAAPKLDLQAQEARLRQAKQNTIPPTTIRSTTSSYGSDFRSIPSRNKKDDLDDLFGDGEVDDEDDLFGDGIVNKSTTSAASPSKTAPARHASPLSAQSESTKHRRPSDDAAIGEPATKRHRSVNNSTSLPSVSPPPKAATPTVPVPAITAKVATTKTSTKPKGVGLSAAPGANSTARPVLKDGKVAKPTAPSGSPLQTSPSRPGQASVDAALPTSPGLGGSKSGGDLSKPTATETGAASPRPGVIKLAATKAKPSILRPNYWPRKK
ncbi:hypothetical protein VTJ04DRAFT_895 [Mycothermus thermophilus]|uniref:uncharacterized protein n=1 Tax=Humicola insolens TaxID=85995 RepID=UPI0037446EFF